MRYRTGLVTLTAASLTACASSAVRPSSSGDELRPEVRVWGAGNALEVKTSRPSYLAIVSVDPGGTAEIAQGGPEPGRHLVPLEPGPLKTVGHGGMGWLSGSASRGAPTQCQVSSELAGRDPQGRPVYRTVHRCAHRPMPDPPAYTTPGARRGYFLVIATPAPLDESRLRNAVESVPHAADPRFAAWSVQSALFGESKGDWSIVVK